MIPRRDIGSRRYTVGEGYGLDPGDSKGKDEDVGYVAGGISTRPRIKRGAEEGKVIEKIPDLVERKPRVRAKIRRFARSRVKRGSDKEVEKPEKKDFKEIKEEIEARFLAPTVENFVETELVSDYKLKASVWLESGYPIHIIGPTGCGKTTLAVEYIN